VDRRRPERDQGGTLYATWDTQTSALSWGSAVSGNSNSEIYAAVVTLTAAR
jgi:hypothetical protein